MPERIRFERELDDLGLREYFGWSIPVVAPPPTVGFEFDVHYGFIDQVVTDAGKTMPADGDIITNHTWATDGFEIKLDGPRLEIATKPFTVDAAGKTDLDQTIANILKFTDKLRKGCNAAAEKSITVPGVSGKPRPFTLAETRVSGIPIVRLPVKKQFHPTNCTVWASPQATVAVRLSKVEALINEIKKSEGKGAGVALTGDNDKTFRRMGLRSEALYKARREVEKSFKALISRRPPLVLSDGTKVDKSALNDHLRGLLILLSSYLWTSELKYDFDETHKVFDYEPFAKAYLPINVKAPFSEIFEKLLNKIEQTIIKEVFAGPARDRLFRLAKAGATVADGSKTLFPTGPKELGLDSVQERQKAEFGGSVLTWDDLIAHTLDSTHRGLGHRLLVPSSKPIKIDKTFPRVALELRRIGFDAVFDHQWKNLMNRIFAMTKKLDS